jgi:hypothetical protein
MGETLYRMALAAALGLLTVPFTCAAMLVLLAALS